MKAFINKGLVLGLVFMSSFANAATHKEAASICTAMAYSSSKVECLQYLITVKEAYFDSGAIGVCKDLAFDSSRNECIQNITGKSYESYEISTIRELAYDSYKNDALERGGEHVGANTGVGQLPSPTPCSDSEDLVFGATSTWKPVGFFAAPKGYAESFTMDIDSNRAVNEVHITVAKSALRITNAYGITESGQYLELPALRGTIDVKGNRKIRLNSNYAVRLQRLVIEAKSNQQGGVRSHFMVQLGLTR